MLARYVVIRGMCEGPMTLHAIDRYLAYYPVDDTHFFIDLMLEIDRRYRGGIDARSKD